MVNTLMIVGIVVAVIAIAAVVWFVMKKKGDTAPVETEQPVQPTEELPAEEAQEATPETPVQETPEPSK